MRTEYLRLVINLMIAPINNEEAETLNATKEVDQRLYAGYAEIEQRVAVRVNSNETTYRSPVNFRESMEKPRHRWFPYKEGFSPSFVNEFINSNGPSGNGLVFDPFSGSGTTSIVAAEQGRKSVGLDVSPLTVFVSKTKSLQLNASEIHRLRNYMEAFMNAMLDEKVAAPANATLERYFEHSVLDALLRVKAFYKSIECEKSQSLFKLAYLTAIEPFSTHRKAGNGVKRKTNYSLPSNSRSPIDALRSFVIEKLNLFVSDIENSKSFHPPCFKQETSLKASALSSIDGISSVLTSPPYANCFDYSKIYMSELWLGDFFTSKLDQAKFRQDSVRSHVHASWKDRHQDFGSELVQSIIQPHVDSQDLWSPKIGGMLTGYFADMGFLLHNLYHRVASGGKLGFVVGNSFYGGIAVATDLLLADLGARHGYQVEEIQVYRGVIPSSQQYKNLGDNRKYMRESLVVFRRP